MNLRGKNASGMVLRCGAALAACAALATADSVQGQTRIRGRRTIPAPAAVGAAAVAANGQSEVSMAEDDRFQLQSDPQAPLVVSGPYSNPMRPAGVPRPGLPVLGRSPNSGVQLTVDASAISGRGYHPIFVEASLPAAAKADVKISIVFWTGNWWNRQRNSGVEHAWTLPKGQTTAKTKFCVAKYQDWYIWGWDLRVDGVKDKALCPTGLTLNSALLSQQQGANLWAVDLGDSPDFATAFTGASLGTTIASTQVLSGEDLPTDWIEYSAADVVMLRGKDFAELSTQQPKQFAALLRWVRAGGNLWLVSELPPPWRALADAAAGLGLESGQDAQRAAEESEEKALEKLGWRFVPGGPNALEPVNTALFLSELRTAAVEQKADSSKPVATSADAAKQELQAIRDQIADGKYPQAVAQAMLAAKTANLVAKRAAELAAGGAFSADSDYPAESGRGAFGPNADSRKICAVRGYGLGMIVAFRKMNRWQSASSQHDLSQTILATRLDWSTRHGNAPDQVNMQFNNWLIPGVGVAPVGLFQGLITLFALGIGPLNYWLLARKRKLPMLLVTVPAAAAAAMLLLFGYGLLSDGVSTRVRARTLTLLDQQAGEAAAWGRMTYYAGFAPREGLRYPQDVTVYPIQPSWAADVQGYNGGGGPTREVSWQADQHLRRGWLASRTPTQYLAIAARKSDKRIEFKQADGKLRATNRLGVDVRQLLVQDGPGQVYWCEDLAEGAVKDVPPPKKPSDAVIALRRSFSASSPEFPPGADPSQGQSMYGGVMLSKNLMEANLDALNSPGLESWGNRTYIAIVEQSPELGVGVEGADEVGSFHVVRGKW